jgi:hypothetical protein
MELYARAIDDVNMWAVKRVVQETGYWFAYDRLRKDGMSKWQAVWTLWIVRNMK